MSRCSLRQLAFSAALLAGVASAETDRVSLGSGTKPDDHTANFDEAWDQYVKTEEGSTRLGLQEGCKPVRFKPNASSDYQGVAVLFHGFSACPQQWVGIAEVLSQRGYDVLVPLTPGHGNKVPTGDYAINGDCLPGLPCDYPEYAFDDPTSLPVTTQGYQEFVEKINKLVRLKRGSHVTAGVSLGGALAAYAGQAAREDGAALYERQLIMNPLLDLPNGFYSIALAIANVLPFSQSRWISWGEGCRRERALGRAGICTFMVKNVAAAKDFGMATLAQMRSPRGAHVAVMYDEADPVIDTSAARSLAEKYRNQTGVDTLSCVLPFTCHSSISRYDDAGTNKWWLPNLSCRVADYLADGVALPVMSARAVSEDNDILCEIGCDNTTCPEILHTKKDDISPLTCTRPGHATPILMV